MSDTSIRGTVSDERISLSGASLSIRFRSSQPIFVCQLRDNSGAILASAPALRFGPEVASAIDLSALPASIPCRLVAIGSDGAVHSLGSASARPLAVLTSASASVRFRKVAGSRFTTAAGDAFATLYADVAAHALYVRVALQDDVEAFLLAADTPAPQTLEAEGTPRYSIVIPIYNVEKYIDECLTSIMRQSADFRSTTEIIAVDDGSTDKSARILQRWQKKFPASIKIVTKGNGGLSSARNAGLKLASGTWVTFIDPDDKIDPDYLRTVDRAIAKCAILPAIVSCNYLILEDANGHEIDGHPLRYRFDAGERLVPSDNLGRDIQVTVNCAFFRRAFIAEKDLSFDVRVRPGFEDGAFVARYLMEAPEGQVLFVPGARYLHRRRTDRSSLQDTARQKPEQYDDEIRFGYLATLLEARTRYGRIPVHFQNMALFGLFFAFNDAIENPQALASLGAERVERYRSLLIETLSLIDTATILENGLGILEFWHQLGLIYRLQNASIAYRMAAITDIDAIKGLARVVSWTPGGVDPVYRLDGQEVAPAFHKRRRRDFLGEPMVWEHIAWVPIEGARLTVSVDGLETRIKAGSETHVAHISTSAIARALAKAPVAEGLLPEKERAVRATARSPAVAARFADAWVFIDRDTDADDSAEHLYHYVRETRPDINAFFVVRRSSPDWNRLAGEGRRRLAFGEPEHALALLNASFVISSHLDRYIWGYMERAAFADMLRYRFIWLQHGVLQADFSRLINFLPLDLMVTTTQAEFDSVVGDGSPYRFTRKETVLAGLPRHDVMLAGKIEDRRTIVVMPTWRLSLTGPSVRAGNRRAINRAFYTSEFATRWKNLLHSPRLRAVADRGHRVVFVPHPNNEPYLDFFEVPSAFEVDTFHNGKKLRETFRRVSLYVTDYSSKAFDVAIMGKPVIYYQFDMSAVLGGAHLGLPGYFDYRRDGFGPVFNAEDEVLGEIERIAAGGVPDSVYGERAAVAFRLRDGKSRERVLAAILAMTTKA